MAASSCAVVGSAHPGQRRKACLSDGIVGGQGDVLQAVSCEDEDPGAVHRGHQVDRGNLSSPVNEP